MSQDEKAREALEILRQALDAALIQLSMNLGVKTLGKPVEVQFKFDMNQIAWTKKENENGPLEIARENANDKNNHYFEMKDFLVQGGKGDMHGLAVGEWYCWIFPDGDAVGRRLLSVIAQRRSKK
jgi:hypothetical protein